MTVLKDKLTEALNAKDNDINSFVWKFSRDSDGTQKEIRMVDATDDQLRSFYAQCQSMLHSKSTEHPGRYPLLEIIKRQRHCCNVELFLRDLKDGKIFQGKEYPRFLYLQDLREFLENNRTAFPKEKYKEIPISYCSNGIPKEYERITIDDVINGCLDQLGYFDNKRISFNFILKMGICLTPEEMKDFNEVDANGKKKSKPEQIKERLNLKPSVHLQLKPTGLTFKELRSLINLKRNKYSGLTTDQLTLLRNKILFRLENEVQFHIAHWEKKCEELEKVAASRGIKLD